MKLQKPARIKAGDTIGIVGMSSPCKTEMLQQGCEKLESLGFKLDIRLDPAASAETSGALFSSAPREERARALTDLFESKDVKGIILARGGAGALETLPYLDFSRLAKSPKFFIGFSDSTNLHIPLYQQSGLVTFHGPMAASNFAKADTDSSVGKSIDALISLMEGTPEKVFGDEQLTEVCPGPEVEAPLTGGNLTILGGLIGTPWQPDFANHILLLEDINEKPYRIDRPLRQMKLAGMFDGLKGVVTGYFTEDASDPAPDRFERVLQDIFGDLDIPVYCGAPFGHADPNYTWPYGIKCELKDGLLRYKEEIFND